MELDKDLEDVESLSNKDLARIRDKADEISENEHIRRDLLGSVKKEVGEISTLTKQNKYLMKEIKRDLSNLEG